MDRLEMETKVDSILGMHRYLVREKLVSMRWRLLLDIDPVHQNPSPMHLELMLEADADFEVNMLRCFADIVTED